MVSRSMARSSSRPRPSSPSRDSGARMRSIRRTWSVTGGEATATTRNDRRARPVLRRTPQGALMPAYTPADLPYDVAAVEPHCSAEVLELHHDKHHAAYVAGA